MALGTPLPSLPHKGGGSQVLPLRKSDSFPPCGGRLGRGVGAALLALAMLTASAAAESSFPTRTVRLIVPFAPGGATDITARLVGERLAARWGQSVVIENKPGAGTIVGTSAVANAPA